MRLDRKTWMAIAGVALATAAVLWMRVGGVMSEQVVEGPALVPHAGILIVEDVWIPLLGIRVPQEDPNCIVGGIISQCPLISAASLAERVMGKIVRCALQHFPEDARNWGTCGVIDPATGELEDGPDGVNRYLVRSGWALADDHYTRAYLDLMEQAQADRVGVWTQYYIQERTRTGTLGYVNETNDAGTVEVLETRVRLYGIDAPELSQKCTINGLPYPCGLLASAHLNTLLIARRLICHVDQLADGRYWGRCGDSDGTGRAFLPGTRTLNDQMVRAGWALANRDQTDDYVEAEEEARREGRGMWAGEFVRPAEWRNGKR